MSRKKSYGNAILIAIVLLFALGLLANTMLSYFFTKRKSIAKQEVREAGKLSNTIAVDVGAHLVQMKVIQGYYSPKIDTVYFVIETNPPPGPYFATANAMNLAKNLTTKSAGIPGEHYGWNWKFEGGYTEKYGVPKGEKVATITVSTCNTDLFTLNALIPSFSKAPTFPDCVGTRLETVAKIVDAKNAGYAEWRPVTKVDLNLAK